MISFPIIPSWMAWRAFHHWSELVVCEPTCSTRPVFFTAAATVLASSTVWVMGFSR